MSNAQARSLKIQNDFSVNGIEHEGAVTGSWAAKLSVLAGKVPELSQKEVVCCVMATD